MAYLAVGRCCHALSHPAPTAATAGQPPPSRLPYVLLLFRDPIACNQERYFMS